MNDGDFSRAALTEAELLVCVGCGGVGKTTVSAALALEAARLGRRALVLTIDPARRLADALGVGELGNTPLDLPRERLSALGVPEDGSLSAMMLDMKRTFDDLVERFAESPEARDRVLSNAIYQHISDTLAGSVEYTAMEKVYELHESREFDLVVVDTPPAQHALDFLEAPQRMLDLLDSRLVHMLIHPAFSAGRMGFRLFQRSTRKVLQVIERVTGMGFLEDVSEFLLAFEGMSEGFRERAEHVRALVTSEVASFALVVGPSPPSVRQAQQFLERLETFDIPLTGVIANRVHQWPTGIDAGTEFNPATPEEQAALARALATGAPEGFPAAEAAHAAFACASGYASLVERDHAALAQLREQTRERGRYWGAVAEFGGDVHDLAGLRQISDELFRGHVEGVANDRP